MTHEDIEPQHEAASSEWEYQPPAVFDFGDVFVVTRGNKTGTGDENNQKWD